MELGLDGKTAIVTGGTGGIGSHIVAGLLDEGARVAIVARHATDDGAATTATLRDVRTQLLACDISSVQEVQGMVTSVVERFGTVDILINAAGQTTRGHAPPALSQINDALFWDDVSVKVTGFLCCIRAVTPYMARAGGGRIVSIGGLGARMTGSTVRGVRNIAVEAMTRALAVELAESGISLCVVHPGTVVTGDSETIMQTRARRLGVSAVELTGRIAAESSLGRVITAQELAWLVTFLASPRATAINGTAVAAAGGTRGPIFYD